MPIRKELRLRPLCPGCGIHSLLAACSDARALLRELDEHGIPVLTIDEQWACSLDPLCPKIHAANLESVEVEYADACIACGCLYEEASWHTLRWNITANRFDWTCEACIDSPQAFLAEAVNAAYGTTPTCAWCANPASALLFNYQQEQLPLCDLCLNSACGRQMLRHHWDVIQSMNAACRQPPSG